MLPVYINNFNRYDYLLGILKQFERFHEASPLDVTIVDNGSTLPRLLEWYEAKGHEVYPFAVTLNRGPNDGPRGWMRALRADASYYIVCDNDIDFSPAPADLFERMIQGLIDFPEILKTGPSLRISDVPKDMPFYDRVMAVEGKFWKHRHNDQWWKAEIDTTCIACRTGQGFDYGPALRADEPYAVRHLPYYYIPGQLTEEEQFYFHALPPLHKGGLYWSTIMQDSKVYHNAE